MRAFVAALLLASVTAVLAGPARAAYVSDPTVVGTVAVGMSPRGVAVSPDGTRVYVVNSTSLFVVDAATGSLTATIAISGSAQRVALNPAGSRAYVTRGVDNAISVIDTTTNIALSSIGVGPGAYPQGVAVSPIAARAYVSNFNGRTISVIDTDANTVAATIGGFTVPSGIAISADGSRAYVANRFADTVSVIDTATNTVLATIRVGADPRAIAVHPSGSLAYVANYLANSVSVIDTATNTVTATISVGFAPVAVSVSPDGARVYVANYTANSVSVIDTTSNTVRSTIAVGSLPAGVAVSPDGTRVYTVNEGADSVTVISTGWQPPSTAAPDVRVATAVFRFVLPSGRECSSISPQVVRVGAMVTLPGTDADCRTMPGSTVAGWTIPVPPGSTEYGSASRPFVPDQPVRVVDSQTFTLVPREPILTFRYDANVAVADACVATSAPHVIDDGRTALVWVPRVDVGVARFPDQASCTPPGHVLAGWASTGPGPMTTYAPGAALPSGWADDPINTRTLAARWRARG